MNKYEDGLKTLLHEINFPSKECDVHFGEAMRQIAKAEKDLQELVDKEIELETRKDKLVIGSEWECIVEHYGYFIKTNTQYAIEVGEFVKIRRTEKLHNGRMILYFDKGHNICFDDETHFTLCFKPKGEK